VLTLLQSYCSEFDEVKAGIIDKLAAARQNAAQNLYTEVDILTKDKLPNWVNEQAVLKKVGNTEYQRVNLPIQYKNSEWREEFNKPEGKQFDASWNCDIRFAVTWKNFGVTLIKK